MKRMAVDKKDILHFEECVNTIKDIVLWHQKHTPWASTKIILEFFVPYYIKMGKEVIDTGEPIPKDIADL